MENPEDKPNGHVGPTRVRSSFYLWDAMLYN